MAQRQYESATVFNVRSVDLRHLWEPSTEYKGKKQDKPSWFAGFMVPKTQAQWFSEPALASISAACGKLYANNPHVVSWPVVDGDLPNPETGETSEASKGHWRFSASTSNGMPTVELVQAGGALVKLQNKVGVKTGDYCMVGVTAAVKQNDARGVKLYLNAVVFSAPGEEIVFANSVSGAELMRMAQSQGLQVAGFAGSPGFGGAPGGGFPGPGNPNGHGFTPASPQPYTVNGAPGFTPPGTGSVPGVGNGNPAMQAAPGQFGTAGGGSATFPSSPGTPPNPFGR